MKRSIVMALTILFLGLNGCSRSKEDSVVSAAPVQGNASAPPSVQKESVYVASGPVVVENQVDVSALREGPVVSILAQPGTEVHQGQLLAKLDDRQISADVEAAAAKVRSIEANLKNWQAETKVLQADRDRAEKLYAAQVIAKEELEHVQYKEEADEFEVQREAESLNNAKAVLQSLELERRKNQHHRSLRRNRCSPLRAGRPEGCAWRSALLGYCYGSATGEIHLAGAVTRSRQEGASRFRSLGRCRSLQPSMPPK